MAKRSSPGSKEQSRLDKSLGQHGNSAVRQIDANPAGLRLAVESAAFAQVMRYVGHRYPQPLFSAPQLFQRNRVVEISGGFRVDSGKRQMAQIGAIARLPLCHGLGKPRHLSRDPTRELVRDVGAREGLFHLGLRIVGRAQNLDQTGLNRRLGAIGIGDDFRHRRLAGPSRDAASKHNLGIYPRVVGLETQSPAHGEQITGDLAPPALEHLEHPAFESPPAHPPLDLHPVAVHGRGAMAPAYVDVFRTIVRDHEAVPVGMHLDPARQYAHAPPTVRGPRRGISKTLLTVSDRHCQNDHTHTGRLRHAGSPDRLSGGEAPGSR